MAVNLFLFAGLAMLSLGFALGGRAQQVCSIVACILFAVGAILTVA
jgi:hypothetical protein